MDRWSDEIALEGAQVLLVDDVPDNLRVLKSILDGQGLRLAMAPSGEVALRIAARLKPHLIVLDVMMPGLDGFATCRRLKSNPATADVPVVFVTARSQPTDVVMGFRAGGVDYITKPFQREEVLARVQTHLRTRLLMQRQQELIRHLEAVNRSLAAAREHLAAVVDSIGDAVLTLGPDGRILSANAAVTTLFGYEPGELVGQSLGVILERSEPPALTSSFQEVVGRRREGTTFPMDLVLRPMREGFVAILHDVTVHKKLQDVLRRQSLEDPLTGLANRRHLEDMLEREWRRCYRSQQPLAVIMVDIDDFKAYNDRYGHLEGDRCLRSVAGALVASVRRAADEVARYGGEEFILVLPETQLAGARDIAEGVRRRVEALALPHEASSTGRIVTVSCGVAAAIPREGLTARGLVEAADDALYRAKARGKNRVDQVEVVLRRN